MQLAVVAWLQLDCEWPRSPETLALALALAIQRSHTYTILARETVASWSLLWNSRSTTVHCLPASEQLDETAVLAVAQPSDGSLPISRLGWRLGLNCPGRSGQIWRALIWACELGEKFDMEGVHFEAALLERAGQRWAEGEKRRVPL